MTPWQRRVLVAMGIATLMVVGLAGTRQLTTTGDDPDPGPADVANAADDGQPQPQPQPRPRRPAQPEPGTTAADDTDADVAGSNQSGDDGEAPSNPDSSDVDDSDVDEADADDSDVDEADADDSDVDEADADDSDVDEADADSSDGDRFDGGEGDADRADGDRSDLEESEKPVEPGEEKGPVTIAFGGDMHFERDLGVRLTNETDTMMASVADMMADADLAIANLETTVTDRGTPTPGKAYNFRTSPEAFDAIRASGIDVVSMANNHGMDFGVVGLEDTLAAAEDKDFPLLGAGLNADEAFAPYVTTINGQSIAVLGATQVLDDSVRTLWTATDDQPGLASAKEVDVIVDAVTKARAEHDTVVVYLHWGIEGDTCPAPRQLELSDQLIAAGADIIVGGHAHRLQAGGLKDGAFVHYGMGNFVFYKYSGPSTESGVLRVTIDGREIEDYEWVPARLEGGVAASTDSADDLASWNNLRACSDLTE